MTTIDDSSSTGNRSSCHSSLKSFEDKTRLLDDHDQHKHSVYSIRRQFAITVAFIFSLCLGPFRAIRSEMLMVRIAEKALARYGSDYNASNQALPIISNDGTGDGTLESLRGKGAEPRGEKSVAPQPFGNAISRLREGGEAIVNIEKNDEFSDPLKVPQNGKEGDAVSTQEANNPSGGTDDVGNAVVTVTTNTSNTKEDKVLSKLTQMEAKRICTVLGWPCADFQRLFIPPEKPEQIVRGPGTYKNGTKREETEASNYAICKFIGGGGEEWHFPHTMQRLYMCWAWWVTNPKKIPILAIPWDFRPKIARSNFNSGIMSTVEAMGIRFAHFSPINTTPVAVERPSKIERVDNITDEDIERLHVNPVHSGYAFSSYDDANKLREGVVREIFPNRFTSECGQLPRIGILNRKRTRALANAELISSVLTQQLRTNVTIKYFEGKTFEDQIDFYSSHDVVISPHGAQLTGALFLPKCAGLLEIFPRGYHIAHLFPALVAGTGRHYGHLYESAGDKLNETAEMTATAAGRTAARAGKLCPSVIKVLDGAEKLVKAWRDCCSSSNNAALASSS